MAYVRPVFDRKLTPGDPRRRPIGYEVRYRDGDGVQRTKGGFRRRRDADAWASDLETSRHQGTLVPHSHGSTRLVDVADEWLASIQDRRRPKTVDGYEKLLNVHVRPAFARRSVGSITYADADRFVRSIEAAGRRPATARNAFFVLKMVLDYAVRSGRIRHNPCSSVDLPSPASPEMLFLTATQVRTLAAAVDDRWSSRRRRNADAPPPYGLLIEFAAFTGLRAGEIAALRVGDLDLRAGTIRVARSAAIVRGRWVEGEPKTKAGRRTVVINRAIAERLACHLQPRILDRESYVFAGTDGNRLNYGTFYSLHFKPGVAAVLPADLHGLRFHDLRHTYASLLVAEGAHPKEMAELMGHSSVQITLDRYSHMMPHMAATLADRLDATYRSAEPISPAGEVSARVVAIDDARTP
jgi:integrase